MTSDHGNERGVSRRKVLECMTWAGTGVLWTVAGGVPSSMGIIGEAIHRRHGLMIAPLAFEGGSLNASFRMGP